MKSLADVRTFLHKRFEGQKTGWLVDQGPWPLTVNLEPPTDKEVLADMNRALTWLQAWRGYEGAGELQWETRAWSKMGTHSVPVRLSYATAAAVATEIGLTREWSRVRDRYRTLCQLWPVLCGHGVVSRNYRTWGDLDEPDFAKLLHLLQWVSANPKSDCYLRELPVEGLHTKWLENRKGLVRDLAIAIGLFPADCEDLEMGLGLKRKPRRVRLRIVCPELRSLCLGLEDLELPVEHAERLPIQPSTLLIVENQETGLAVPELPGTVVLMGLGYAVSVVEHLPWLHSAKRVVYWGDIDTHGFAILAAARAIRRDIASVLMDMQAWTVHAQHAAHEKRGAGRFDLALMDESDRVMLEHLQTLVQSPVNRLEQERLSWALCLARIRELVAGHELSPIGGTSSA
jgi:hypothetical protein